MPPRVLGYDDYDAVLWAPMTCGSDGHASGGPGAGITARGPGSWVFACLGKGPIGETFLTLIEFRYIQRVDWKGRLPVNRYLWTPRLETHVRDSSACSHDWA